MRPTVESPESEQTTAAAVVLVPAAEVPDKGDSEAAVDTDLDAANVSGILIETFFFS